MSAFELGPAGPVGAAGGGVLEYILASSVSAGGTTITLDRAPFGIGLNVGWVAIDPGTVECEIFRVTSIAGTVLTLQNNSSLTSSAVVFDGPTKTIKITNNTVIRRFFAEGGGTKVVVSGSASNNGVFTVVSITPRPGTSSTGLDTITVAETVVTEAAGPSVTLRSTLNFNHAANDKVWLLYEDRVHLSLFGVKGSEVVADAPTNQQGWNRAMNQMYWQNLTHLVCPPGVIYVNDECWVEDLKHLWGPDMVNGKIRATLVSDGTAPWLTAWTDEVAIIHGRDGGQPCSFTTGAGGCRASFHNLMVHGGNTSSGVGSTVGGSPQNPDSNGILLSGQQPQDMDFRADNCDGYGICIAGTQQVDMGRVEIVRNRVGILLRQCSFVYINDSLNMEENVECGMRTQQIDSADVALLIDIQNIHTEHHGVVPTVAEFDLVRCSSFKVGTARHASASGSTIYNFVSGSTPTTAPVYLLENMIFTGNPTTTTAVEDVLRGHSLLAYDAMGSDGVCTIAGGNSQAAAVASPDGYHAHIVLGNGGGWTRVGCPAFDSTYKPGYFATRLGTSAGRHQSGKTNADALVWAVDNDGVTLRNGLRVIEGTGTPEAVITAPIGSIYLRSNGTAGNVLYLKESGSGNTGWVRLRPGVAGATSVADGGTVTHGMVATPTIVTAVPSVAGEMVAVTALGATTFTVAIKKHDGTAGTTQTVYWRAST